jgi:hypothetical protein
MKSRPSWQRLQFIVAGGALLATLLATLAAAGAAAETALPYSVERFSLPGPVAGVLVKVDLRDPQVHVKVALADDRDPDGAGPCVGRLDTVSNAARKLDLSIALNASFFAVPVSRERNGKKIPYFLDNCGYPEGWHFSSGKLIASPQGEKFHAALVVHADGQLSLHADLRQPPVDARFIVSGSALILSSGKPTIPAIDILRHPRSAVGLSADRRTLLMVAVDGRQEPHSRGVTLAELAALMQGFGADSALNLDGGGSTSLVLKDPASGVVAIVNRPSDQAALAIAASVERPVIDLIGIQITP